MEADERQNEPVTHHARGVRTEVDVRRLRRPVVGFTGRAPLTHSTSARSAVNSTVSHRSCGMVLSMRKSTCRT